MPSDAQRPADRPLGAPLTKEDVRAEHDAAMISLSPAQIEAFKRISRAFMGSRFNNRSARETMETVFEDEAKARNAAAGTETVAGAGPDQA